MRLLVITSENQLSGETETIHALFDHGLKGLHVRKPCWEKVQVLRLLDGIKAEHYAKISIHGHLDICHDYGLGGFHLKSEQHINMGAGWKGTLSRSFHDPKEMETGDWKNLNYGFLSPVFSSISKRGYQAKWLVDQLKGQLASLEVPFEKIALGGISLSNIALVKSIGFDGAAVLGSVWNEDSLKSRVEVFKKLTNHV